MSIAAISDTRQYLTFELEGETFALEVSYVREILELTTVTKVPKTPAYMTGVINLRGSVVPVFDVRQKFEMGQAEKTINTCIVVVEVSMEQEKTVIGALVDSVQEVFELEPDQIEPAPKIGTRLRTDFIKGMGKKDDRFIIILDIDKVFSADDLNLAGEMDETMKLAGNE
jgi:purine-binding chemotaxis protein CheW